jgi:hypothetical protein
MRKFMKVSLAAAFALGWTGLDVAKPPTCRTRRSNTKRRRPKRTARRPPTRATVTRRRPPVAYGYPPPAPYYEYAPPPYVVVPGPYYVRGPYWRGYPADYAYSYGPWGNGYRRW